MTPPVTGGSPDREARGQRFMCYPRNPRCINLFVRVPDREDRWPRWSDRVLCDKVLCAFSAPYKPKREFRKIGGLHKKTGRISLWILLVFPRKTLRSQNKTLFFFRTGLRIGHFCVWFGCTPSGSYNTLLRRVLRRCYNLQGQDFPRSYRTF